MAHSTRCFGMEIGDSKERSDQSNRLAADCGRTRRGVRLVERTDDNELLMYVRYQ